MHPWHLHGMPMRVVARDGYYLGSAEFTCDTLGVNPGERYDVVIDCDNPGAWGFHCHILQPRRGIYRDVRDGHGTDRGMTRASRRRIRPVSGCRCGWAARARRPAGSRRWIPRRHESTEGAAVIIESAAIMRRLGGVFRTMVAAIPVAGTGDHGERGVDGHRVGIRRTILVPTPFSGCESFGSSVHRLSLPTALGKTTRRRPDLGASDPTLPNP